MRNEAEQSREPEAPGKAQQKAGGLNGPYRGFFIVGVLLLLSELWKQYVLNAVLSPGGYRWEYFPFQLCSLPVYLCLLLSVTKQEKLRDACLHFLADFTVLSGTLAFLDTTGMHYGYAPLTIHSFAWHIVILLTGISAGLQLRKEHKEGQSFLPAAALYLLGCGIAELLNLCLDSFGYINMFYINPHYRMNQIVFRELGRWLPNSLVILIYAASAMAGAYLIHRLWAAGSRK